MTPLRKVLHAYKVDDLTAAQAEAAIHQLFDDMATWEAIKAEPYGRHGLPDEIDCMYRTLTDYDEAGAYNLARQNEIVGEMWPVEGGNEAFSFRMYGIGRDGT
jgi:hypothetical protein